MSVDFVLFMVPLFFSPGLINIIASASAFKNGIRKTLPFFFGVLIVAGLYAFFIGFWASYLFVKFPIIIDIVRYIGVAFFIYISMRFFQVNSDDESSTSHQKTMTFIDGLIIQSLNPKYPIILMTIFSEFLSKSASSFEVIKLVVFIELFFVAAIFTWAFIGIFFATFIRNKNSNIINPVFGCMFIFLAIWLLIKI